MKKIVMIVLLSTMVFGGEAKQNIVEAFGMCVAGILLFPTIVIGDIQYGRLLSKDICDDQHYIYAIVPSENGLVRTDFAISCTEWEEMGGK